MRIALDIDSTLHHYWDLLARTAKRRFGVDLRYESQSTWDITLLKPRQLKVCVEETHSDDAISRAEPYAGAVEAVRAWHDAGHEIHVMSHRAERCHDATAAWLQRVGLPYDALHCSEDKVALCRELGIDVLVDDSPVNLQAALDAGLAVATLVHPWNRDLCETEEVVCARDWPELARRMEAVLGTPAAGAGAPRTG